MLNPVQEGAEPGTKSPRQSQRDQCGSPHRTTPSGILAFWKQVLKMRKWGSKGRACLRQLRKALTMEDLELFTYVQSFNTKIVGLLNFSREEQAVEIPPRLKEQDDGSCSLPTWTLSMTKLGVWDARAYLVQ